MIQRITTSTSIQRSKTDSVEVYDPRTAHWTDIKARLLSPKSHFAAVKHLKKAYLVGGSKARYLETFDLDTGESSALFQGFRFDEAVNWSGLMLKYALAVRIPAL